MSTLQTLRVAFAELERRADTMSPAPVGLASGRSRPTRRHRPRRALAPLAVAAVVAVVLGGSIIAGVTVWPSHTEQPAAAPTPGVITLWQAEAAPCPAQPARHAAADAVLRYLDGCVRLDNLAATFTSPLPAQVANSNGRWTVQVTLNEQQASTFTRATTDAIGHQLAIVGDGQVLSAPEVREPITGKHLLIAAASADEANNVAHLLGNP